MTIIAFMGMILIEGLFEGAMEHRDEKKRKGARR